MLLLQKLGLASVKNYFGVVLSDYHVGMSDILWAYTEVLQIIL